MNVLLSLLHSSPEYESLRAMLDAGQTAAVSDVYKRQVRTKCSTCASRRSANGSQNKKMPRGLI